MNDIIITAEPRRVEPIFALDIDSEDPLLSLSSESEPRYADAAERVRIPNYCRRVYDEFPGGEFVDRKEPFVYSARTTVRFADINVDGTIVPVVSKHTKKHPAQDEGKFSDDWYRGCPEEFLTHSLLQREVPTEGIWMLDFKALGYQNIGPVLASINMFTPVGRRSALDTLRQAAGFFESTRSYGVVADVFPKGFVVRPDSRGGMSDWRTYDFSDIHPYSSPSGKTAMREAWWIPPDLSDPESKKSARGIFSWLPLMRPFDNTTMTLDGPTEELGLRDALGRLSVMREEDMAYTVLCATSSALRRYNADARLQHTTSPRQRSAIEAGAAIADYFDCNPEIVDRVNWLAHKDDGTLDASVKDDWIQQYFLVRDELKTLGPIAGRLRISVRQTADLVKHLPDPLAASLFRRYITPRYPSHTDSS